MHEKVTAIRENINSAKIIATKISVFKVWFILEKIVWEK